MKKYWIIFVLGLLGAICFVPKASAQITAPTITATSKGPDQINLTWSAATTPGYGYLIEIMSAGDSRYGSFTELAPIKTATGYTHSAGNACTIDDPTGAYVYNPPNHGLPLTVIDANHIDPQDGTAAQFMAFGLKPNVSYSFRVRTFTGMTPSAYSAYSNTATATTANYSVRYVATTGNDANGGMNPTTDAWRTIDHAATTVTSSTIVLIEAGTYANDQLWPANSGSDATHKIVFAADTGATVTLSAPPLQGAGSSTSVIQHPYTVVDGISMVVDSIGDWGVYLESNHDAFVNSPSIGPPTTILPDNYGDIQVTGANHNLIYGNYVHDSGIPCAAENPDGGDGFPLVFQGSNNDVITSNHVTRGAHDTSLCKGIDAAHHCTAERFLDNVYDGGFGIGVTDVAWGDGSLFQANIIYKAGQLETGIYKPPLQISGPNTTARYNVIINPAAYGTELSALNTINIPGVLVYNNTWYLPSNGGCFWMSDMMSMTSMVIANNICTSTHAYSNVNLGTLALAYDATSDTTNSVTKNDFVYLLAGVAQPSALNYQWSLEGATTCTSSPCSLATMQSTYNPPWAANITPVDPLFGNVATNDFHLTSSSTLLSVGVAVTDSTWGSLSSDSNLGALAGTYVAGITTGPGTVGGVSFVGGTAQVH